MPMPRAIAAVSTNRTLRRIGLLRDVSFTGRALWRNERKLLRCSPSAEAHFFESGHFLDDALNLRKGIRSKRLIDRRIPVSKTLKRGSNDPGAPLDAIIDAGDKADERVRGAMTML
jgi:hypothetical protein